MTPATCSTSTTTSAPPKSSHGDHPNDGPQCGCPPPPRRPNRTGERSMWSRCRPLSGRRPHGRSRRTAVARLGDGAWGGAGAGGGRGGGRAGPRAGPGGGGVGGLVVLVGIGVGLGQALGRGLGGVGWPLLVIVPGLALLGVGLTAAGRLGEVLATLGGLVTMAGLVLGVQNATDRFDTWAYAWPLVVLVGPGIGRWLVGVVRGRGDLAASGGWVIGAGLRRLAVVDRDGTR